jgi:predicted AAA+ superfamily ATPase
MLDRATHTQRVRELLEVSPVVALLGARQVGKTTLARQIATGAPHHWFDLEDPDDRARLQEPKLALGGLKGLVVLDEVQLAPELFGLLRVLSDRPGTPARFLILGSAGPELLRQGSQSLAGRIAFHHLEGFDLDEVGGEEVENRWVRGGFPRSFLARDDTESLRWRNDFIATFLERDLPRLGITIGAPTMRRFWTMLAHWHGQTWNGAALARNFGVSDKTVRGYLDILESTFVARQLQPWHENLGKRQVKSPKIYLRDSGLLHALLGIPSETGLQAHPKVGASWEGFVLGQVVRRLGARPEECFFWATHGGSELDLLVVRGSTRRGFEFKRTTAPRRTRSMTTALADLKLDSLDALHAGEHTFPIGERMRAVAVGDLLEQIDPL